ncbi:hypothetical protein ACS0TY_024982 [Phlomoides rotata]
MSAVSGVISRQILPACGSLCFFCPAMRARSRQPVKRYKKLISDIFPKSQDDQPNDRMIGKLCEYAAKNPLRIPKIASSLEQKCYKELRNENFRSVKIVMCIYRKLISSCKEQMPLFANSVITIMQTLLDQANQDDMLIIACQTLFDFVNNQKDGIYMFTLDGFIPKLCQMAQEIGEDERAKLLKASGLQALSAMVWLMGENSHISAEFDNIVSVVLENYGCPNKNCDGNQNHWVQEVHKSEGNVCHSSDAGMDVPSWEMIVNDKGQLNVPEEDSKNPSFWSRVCLRNMAKLGKEATTMRRVLESLFRYFDNGNLWNAKDGIAFPVLKEMQILMDNSGENTHFLLSILVKHLDHKNVLKQPDMQLDIVQVATSLARLTKVKSSVAIVSAVSDIMRHLRKCIHSSLDDANLGSDLVKWNKKFHAAVDECLVELSSKVGDAGLILDVMATMLENIPSITVIARTTISAVYRTAQIIATLPNLSYKNKAFPESLFHQVLPAMLHPDHDTRIGAHQIFSVVLVPSSIAPQSEPAVCDSKKNVLFPRTLSRTVSVFSSSAALFEKLKNQRHNKEIPSELNNERFSGEIEQRNGKGGVLNKIKSSYSRVYSFRSSSPPPEAESVTKPNKEVDAVPLRLSSHQINVLLSSIWLQSISPANLPEDYVAIAHTYSLMLLFSRAKTSYLDVLIRSFQLAFSLRNISLDGQGTLSPSRRRSLFVLSNSMILFSLKAYNIIPVAAHVRVFICPKSVDPFLCLIEESKLQTIDNGGHKKVVYGSQEDDVSAQKCLSEIKLNEEQTTESLVSAIIKHLDNFPKLEESTTSEQLLKEFLPDELGSLKGPWSNDNQHERHGSDSNDHRTFEKAASIFVGDDDSMGQNKQNSQLIIEFPNCLSVDQLMESVLETAHNVSRMSVSTAPDASYKEMANHCETLLMGKKQKMSNLISIRHKNGNLVAVTSSTSGEENKGGNPSMDQNGLGLALRLGTGASGPCAAEVHHYQSSLRLPASSPYDNFLKAAGC